MNQKSLKLKIISFIQDNQKIKERDIPVTKLFEFQSNE